MDTSEKEQQELQERLDHPERFHGEFLFNERYPVWRCPDCGKLNRFADTFFETCYYCGADHTLDWVEFKVNK